MLYMALQTVHAASKTCLHCTYPIRAAATLDSLTSKISCKLRVHVNYISASSALRIV